MLYNKCKNSIKDMKDLVLQLEMTADRSLVRTKKMENREREL